MENSGRQFFFQESERRERVCGRNDGDFSVNDKIKYKHADYLYTFHWKTTTNESNAGRIYTQFRATTKCFKSTLNLLLSPPFGEEMYPTENCRLVLCSMFKTIFPFAFCQDDRRIAMLNIEIFH